MYCSYNVTFPKSPIHVRRSVLLQTLNDHTAAMAAHLWLTGDADAQPFALLFEDSHFMNLVTLDVSLSLTLPWGHTAVSCRE